MKVAIREGNEADLASARKIEELCFPHPKTIEELKSRMAGNPNPYFIVAEVEGQVVGYELGYEVKGKLYNAFKAIAPDYQRQGIGKLLLEKQLEIAKKMDYPSVFVKTSNQFPGMLIFCLKNGFKIIGYKANEWGDNPAIWLERTV